MDVTVAEPITSGSRSSLNAMEQPSGTVTIERVKVEGLGRQSWIFIETNGRRNTDKGA
jgi:hypothetical protein